MTILRNGCIAFLLCCGCYGQNSQAPATASELKFFRYMLMSVASIDHAPQAVAAYEASLTKNFGLTAQESAVIHAAGQQLNTLLKQIRAEEQAITHGKPLLSAADANALANLTSQRDQMIATLSNEILNSVNPATAARLRAPGKMVSGGK